MSFTEKVRFVQRDEGDEGRARASQMEATAREKVLQGSEHGGPCDDFGFHAEENGEPLQGTEQRHDMILLTF